MDTTMVVIITGVIVKTIDLTTAFVVIMMIRMDTTMVVIITDTIKRFNLTTTFFAIMMDLSMVRKQGGGSLRGSSDLFFCIPPSSSLKTIGNAFLALFPA
eukprot:1160104-Pelagomonas_calceolata.AAC.4